MIAVPEGKEFVCPDCGSPLVPEEEVLRRPSRSRKGGLGLFLLLLLLLGGGAGLWLALRGQPSPKTAPAPPSPPPPMTPPPPIAERTLFTVSGSRILAARLVPELVQAFLSEELRATEVAIRRGRDGRSLVVAGKSAEGKEELWVRIAASSTAEGWKDLAEDRTQIAMAFRRITPEEAALFGKAVNITAPDSEHVIGVSGIAAIVSPANPVSQISLSDLRKIFQGWEGSGKALGFPGGKIALYAPAADTAGWQLFARRVLGGAPGSSAIIRLESGEEVSSRVAADARALGIVDFPHIGRCKALALYEKGTIPLAPTFASLESEAYLLSTRLYLYTKGSGRNPDVDAFIQFALSDRGQQVVQKVGFVGAATKAAEAAESLIQPKTEIPRDAPMDYRDLVKGGNRVAFDVRFRTGSAELDNKALVDIRRLAKVMSERGEADQAVLLIGFTDNVGDRAYNLRLSVERAKSVGQALRVLGIPVAATAGEGDQMPVASNDTPEGREKNRRVELWIVQGKAAAQP
ncbi:phosphate ABC transporter substrate-binding/OmpA family protein [Methylacidimicrobium sp. AP8]|uniref:phosphate ABC transporter substrate-binding/OmpA family protein n=1 Tax=Methylacidimicrobium sp. AP8 TaxID=2730359 RepID=UPI001921EF42|nr:phosphate ABC transporter substrate-binding/OmpA family protein [Methylacidimicrobium sp. AP8]